MPSPGPDALSYEERVLGVCFSAATAAYLASMRQEHNAYLMAAQRLEREVFSAWRQFHAVAQGKLLPDSSDERRTLAATRAGECWQALARCGEAWTSYGSIRDRPTEEIVLLMCEEGYCEHARYIETGDWMAEDSEAA